jgi:hypothetical protein
MICFSIQKSGKYPYLNPGERTFKVSNSCFISLYLNPQNSTTSDVKSEVKTISGIDMAVTTSAADRESGRVRGQREKGKGAIFYFCRSPTSELN